MDFDKAVEKLGRFTPMLRNIPGAVKNCVADIRLRVGKPVVLCCGNRNYFLMTDGSVATAVNGSCALISQEDMNAVFHRLCGYSVYSHIDEICNGYISVDRSLRVGIGGTAVVENGNLRTIRSITSLSIRIPREICGCADEILRAGVQPERGILIAGAPSSGKTTLLRDLARTLGNRGRRTVVLDERFELLADGFDLGVCTDVLQGYPKKSGFSHAIRCLAPEFILCDELGEDDLPAIQAAAFAGVAMVATVHVGSVAELRQRPLCRRLLEIGIFGCVIFLGGRTPPLDKPKIMRAGDLFENYDDDAARTVRFCSRSI